ncbi:MAG: NAD(+)/NADH kinase [Oscillospiraceae bacterium]|nr:NAD(+)/NADH kinase [Oscillospiraceae bacterium]
MKIILSPNPYRDRGLRAAQSSAKILREAGVDTVLCLPFEPDPHFELPRHLVYSDMDSELADADMLICFGGDGTLLHAAKQAYNSGVPIMGVNMGSVGFLAELEHSELSKLARIAKREYTVEPRMMLDVSLIHEGQEIYADHALNDAAITKGAVARVVEMSIFSDGEQIASVSGDGVVVATPTGSTAYSLSAGGPIVEPKAQNLIITPIAAHALQSKSIVLAQDRVVEVRLARQARKTAYLSVDGGRAVRLSGGDTIRVTRSERCVDLVHLTDRSFYQILLSKLGRA